MVMRSGRRQTGSTGGPTNQHQRRRVCHVGPPWGGARLVLGPRAGPRWSWRPWDATAGVHASLNNSQFLVVGYFTSATVGASFWCCGGGGRRPLMGEITIDSSSSMALLCRGERVGESERMELIEHTQPSKEALSPKRKNGRGDGPKKLICTKLANSFSSISAFLLPVVVVAGLARRRPSPFPFNPTTHPTPTTPPLAPFALLAMYAFRDVCNASSRRHHCLFVCLGASPPRAFYVRRPSF